MRNPRPPKGQPTHTNLFALARLFGGADEVSNRIDSSSAPHIRRCLDAGLVEVVDRKTLRLTPAGRAAVATVPPPPPPRPAPPPLPFDPTPRPERMYFRVRLGQRFLGSPVPATIEDNHNLAAVFDDREDAERAAAAAVRYHGQEARVETFFLGLGNPPGRRNSDEDFRRLERAAAAGDPQAQSALVRTRERLGLTPARPDYRTTKHEHHGVTFELSFEEGSSGYCTWTAWAYGLGTLARGFVARDDRDEVLAAAFAKIDQKPELAEEQREYAARLQEAQWRIRALRRNSDARLREL